MSANNPMFDFFQGITDTFYCIFMKLTGKQDNTKNKSSLKIE